MAQDILSRIVAQKNEEVAAAEKKVSLAQLKEQAKGMGARRGFMRALTAPDRQGKINIIAEVKRASPSKGAICMDLDPARLAADYQAGGAVCLSVLTDSEFFKGSLDDLKKARKATTLPVLRKDFILSEYQVYEAFVAGADAVLLIVRILSQSQLKDLFELTQKLQMDALVEIYAEEELERAKKIRAPLIGINNRNLKSFDTDIGHAMNLFNRLDVSQVGIAASGISSTDDVAANVKQGVYNFLIGESLVRAQDPVAFLKKLCAA